jgi:hypothetical protein
VDVREVVWNALATGAAAAIGLVRAGRMEFYGVFSVNPGTIRANLWTSRARLVRRRSGEAAVPHRGAVSAGRRRAGRERPRDIARLSFHEL